MSWWGYGYVGLNNLVAFHLSGYLALEGRLIGRWDFVILVDCGYRGVGGFEFVS